ncbi:MAG: glycoside hydrolase family 25 protein [Clostridia bacterium]|nr:glycoside hydrolase family 25 protein [Clostridia bacterium]
MDGFIKDIIKYKYVILVLVFLLLVAGWIVISDVSETSSSSVIMEKKLALKEQEIEEVTEEVISVYKDLSVDESLVEEEEEVTYKDKKVKVPKSKVSSVNSAEDGESNKKNGGQNVSQDQAQTMFENVGTKSMGIDVSHHNGKINWTKVRESGVEFAMIRVGYRGQTSGGIYEDAYFKTNVNGAVAAGIKVGIYFYSTAINETEALEEAAWVVKKIAPYRITFPVVYDFEDFNSKRCASVGGAEATKNANTFLNFVKSKGYEPMMYANKSDITSRMSRSSFSCKFWLAHYTSQTDYTGNVNMWQYTSKGSVPGISGNVDMNIAYFNYGTVAEPKHTHKFDEEVKNSLVEPTCEKDGSKVMACSCGDKETQVIKAIGHKWDDGKVIKVATKEETGLKEYRCLNKDCKGKKEEVLEKLEDSTGNKNTNSNTNSNNANTNSNNNSGNTNTNNNNTNTNTNNGQTTHTCTWIEDKRTESTCTEDGKVTYKCKDEKCTKTKEETLKSKGHSYGDWVITKEPAVGIEGEKERTCSVCGGVDSGKVDALPNPEPKPEPEPENPGEDDKQDEEPIVVE